MLKTLELTNVGPSPYMKIDFAERLNLLTGDNGLGKSFILDICWWALTRRWPAEINNKLQSGYMARPSQPSEKASIAFALRGEQDHETLSWFDRKMQAWTVKSEEFNLDDLVIYAQADGSFAIYDPARNLPRKRELDPIDSFRERPHADYLFERPYAYVFTPKEAWDGLYDLPFESMKIDNRRILCNGLIADWAGWQKEKGKAFHKLRSVLEALSPSPEERIKPGSLTRISVDDPRDYPTLDMAYGQNIPIIHASAGMKRIFTFAYLLVWTWEEHRKASEMLDLKPSSQLVFLVDEIESHLHPRWQRKIIRTLLQVMESLKANVQVQIVTSTHSPMLMASVEPLFDYERDAWFDLDLSHDNSNKPRVELYRREFERQGDASNWLTSEAFNLKEARSIEAEKILEEASIALSDESFDAAKARELNTKLRGVLSETDPFWMRWRYVAEKRGWIQ